MIRGKKKKKNPIFLQNPIDAYIYIYIYIFFFTERNHFTKLSKLTDLILRYNSFDKEVLKFLDALPVLKYLDLCGNKMEGPLLGEGTCHFLQFAF